MILSSCALLLSLLLVAFVWLRRLLERREAHRQAKDFEEQMEKERLGMDIFFVLCILYILYIDILTLYMADLLMYRYSMYVYV